MTVFKGTTVRLKAEFKDLDGNLTDIDDVKVKIYSGHSREEVVEISASRESEGIYFVDYTIPLYEENLVCEFSGMFGGLWPVLRRDKIEETWI